MTEWAPLCAADPVPGDVVAVADQARHFSRVAAELRSQVSRLQRIGADGTLVGAYADRLREVAGDLVGDLEQVERRYTAVSAALRGWEPELRDAQQDAERLRVRAQELDEERRRLQGSSAARTPADLSAQATPAQADAHDLAVLAAAGVARRVGEIGGEIERLRSDLGDVTQRRTDAGRRAANAVREAIDDDIKDTRWENVKGAVGDVWRAVDHFIDEHIEVILKVVEILGYIATALAILALFIPGINLLVVAIAAGLVLSAKTLLYATGNGSLADVLLAALALVTLGAGRLATAVLSRAATATRAAGATRAATTGVRSAKAETQAARAALGRRLGRRLTPAQRTVARAELNALQSSTSRTAAGRAAQGRADVLSPALAPATRGQGAAAGWDRTNAQLVNDVTRTRAMFPGSSQVATAGRTGPGLTLARGSFGAGAVLDIGDTGLGKSDLVDSKPYSPGWERAKSGWDPWRR